MIITYRRIQDPLRDEWIYGMEQIEWVNVADGSPADPDLEQEMESRRRLNYREHPIITPEMYRAATIEELTAPGVRSYRRQRNVYRVTAEHCAQTRI